MALTGVTWRRKARLTRSHDTLYRSGCRHDGFGSLHVGAFWSTTYEIVWARHWHLTAIMIWEHAYGFKISGYLGFVCGISMAIRASEHWSKDWAGTAA